MNDKEQRHRGFEEVGWSFYFEGFKRPNNLIKIS